MTKTSAAQTYAPIGPSTLSDVVQCPPTEGPYDWADDVWGADSFVFRVDMSKDVTPAHFS